MPRFTEDVDLKPTQIVELENAGNLQDFFHTILGYDVTAAPSTQAALGMDDGDYRHYLWNMVGIEILRWSMDKHTNRLSH